MLRKIFGILFLLLTLAPTSKASHIIGSDFSYQCIGNNTYRFTLSIYRDCRPESQGGGTPGALTADNPAVIAIFNNGFMIKKSEVPYSELRVVPPDFSNDCVLNPPIRCVSLMRFTFVEQLPASPNEYTLVYQRCCRNASTINLKNAGATGNSFMCTIPPSTVVCNNSAVFKNNPPQITCINNPFIFDCSATDVDGDSLSYELCAGLNGGSQSNPKPGSTIGNPPPANPPPPPYVNIVYQSPFTALNPMAGNPQISINPTTGFITGTPNLQGIFALSICCHEWRNGVKINTTRREFQVDVTNCSKAVVANIPVLSNEPNTFIIKCDGLTVNFINNSSGGFKYHWDFGVSGSNSDTSDLQTPSFTYPDTGTYVVKLVVNDGTTCPDSIERVVKVYPVFLTDYTYDGLFCPEYPIDFIDLSSSSNYPVTSWFWDFNDGTTSSIPNPTHSFPNEGKLFKVTLISGNSIGCRDTLTKDFEIKKVDLNAGNDTIVLTNTPVTFNATGALTYTWSPFNVLDNPSIANPTALFPDTGRFQFIVTGLTGEGCPDFDTLMVYVTQDSYLLFPTAFSPNGDGKNDVAKILGAGFKKLNSLEIYNRWGQQIFRTADFREGWDGTFKGEPQPLSTYFWSISVIDLDDKEKKFRGDITLMR